MNAHRARLWRDQRGAALLEMAMTLPLLLFIAVGIFEFGRAYQTRQVLTNAAREGARIAVLAGVDDATVVARVREYLEAGRLSEAENADVTVDRTATITLGSGTASGSAVTVSYPFEFMVMQPVANLLVKGSTVGQPLTMAVSATMRNETQAQ